MRPRRGITNQMELYLAAVVIAASFRMGQVCFLMRVEPVWVRGSCRGEQLGGD